MSGGLWLCAVLAAVLCVRVPAVVVPSDASGMCNDYLQAVCMIVFLYFCMRG